MDSKPWVVRMLDENANIGPVSGVVVIGAVSFIVVLGALMATQGGEGLSRFVPEQPVPEQTKNEVLAALAAGNTQTATEEEKLEVLKSLAERVDDGEEAIMITESEKLEVLASLQTAK